MLTRNVNYEVPALKKQVVKCKKSQQDCTRKEGEYNSLASELKKKYYDMCQQFGIQVCWHIQKSSVYQILYVQLCLYSELSLMSRAP